MKKFRPNVGDVMLCLQARTMNKCWTTQPNQPKRNEDPIDPVTAGGRPPARDLNPPPHTLE